jgi:protoporphyrinogen oxidase
MSQTDGQIHVVGAGVSGLVAASVLEAHGYHPVVIERTNGVGGRVKTDVVKGFQLDHGFQVLLTSYPEAQKHLDFEALELQKILPGASVFFNKKQNIIGDPLKAISFLLPTLFSRIGSFSDKLRILQLNRALKRKTLSEIFSDSEKSTFSYLQDYGFSNEIVRDFFMPFFGGIFLETKLETSSRMFEFVYKMFGDGEAALPKAGMAAIPKQLHEKLQNTDFMFNTHVASIEEGEITLEDKTKLKTLATIVATDARGLVVSEKHKSMVWKSCQTLYFETDHRVIRTALIGLIPQQGTLINNIFYHTSLKTKSSPSNELLSVTVIDRHQLSDEMLISRVKDELEEHCGIVSPEFMKMYSIPQALPNLQDLKYAMHPSESNLTPGIFLAGDTLLNGSLNAAMISGESAALAAIEFLSQKK